MEFGAMFEGPTLHKRNILQLYESESDVRCQSQFTKYVHLEKSNGKKKEKRRLQNLINA